MAISGRAVLLALLGLPLVIVAPGWLVPTAWAGLWLVLIGLDLVLAAAPGGLQFERVPTSSVRLTNTVDVSLDVTNTGSRTARGLLRDGWVPSAGLHFTRHRLSVPPGERRRLTSPATPTRRGERRADRVTARLFGPLGLAARQRSVPLTGTLRVLPPFHSRKHLPSRLARLRELDGRSAVMVRGQGTEFDSLRDYVIGDDVRSIDWRATARRQQMVVRTWRPERDRRVLLVLDTSRTSAARIGDEPRLDAAMDASLLLAALASKAGDRVDLVAADRQVRTRVLAVNGSALLPALVEAMAPLDPVLLESDWPLIVAEVHARVPHHALVVLLTALDAAAAEEGLLPVATRLAARHTVIVAAVTDPTLAELAADHRDTVRIYDAAAAIRAEQDETALTDALVHAGVHVISATPEDLPPRLADLYLTLKAAGRL